MALIDRRHFFLKLGLALTLIWTIVVAGYIGLRIGWGVLAQLTPGEQGGLLAGYAGVLAFLWVFLTFLKRDRQLAAHMAALEAELHRLRDPLGESDAKTAGLAEALRKRVELVEAATTAADGQLAKATARAGEPGPGHRRGSCQGDAGGRAGQARPQPAARPARGPEQPGDAPAAPADGEHDRRRRRDDAAGRGRARREGGGGEPAVRRAGRAGPEAAGADADAARPALPRRLGCRPHLRMAARFPEGPVQRGRSRRRTDRRRGGDHDQCPQRRQPDPDGGERQGQRRGGRGLRPAGGRGAADRRGDQPGDGQPGGAAGRGEHAAHRPQRRHRRRNRPGDRRGRGLSPACPGDRRDGGARARPDRGRGAGPANRGGEHSRCRRRGLSPARNGFRRGERARARADRQYRRRDARGGSIHARQRRRGLSPARHRAAAGDRARTRAHRPDLRGDEGGGGPHHRSGERGLSPRQHGSGGHLRARAPAHGRFRRGAQGRCRGLAPSHRRHADEGT